MTMLKSELDDITKMRKLHVGSTSASKPAKKNRPNNIAAVNKVEENHDKDE